MAQPSWNRWSQKYTPASYISYEWMQASKEHPVRFVRVSHNWKCIVWFLQGEEVLFVKIWISGPTNVSDLTN